MSLIVHQMAFAAERKLLPRQTERYRRFAEAVLATISPNHAARRAASPRAGALACEVDKATAWFRQRRRYV
jgi:hypothetical protein